MGSMQGDNEQQSAQTAGDDTAAMNRTDRYELPPEPRGGRKAASRNRPRELPYKSSALAAFLSLMPGLGQIYVGYYQRGFVNLAVVASVITILVTSEAVGLDVFFGVFLAFYWMYNIIDAYRRATLFNQALDGLSSIEMPEDFELPDKGSVAGGAFLIVIGVLLLMHTKFDMDMDWLQEWWPLGAIALGVWLIYKARKRKP